MTWLKILLYISSIFFIGSCIFKVIKYSKMPVHIRWELYPMAYDLKHESVRFYSEELNWREKNLRRIFIELKYILREGLFFQKCFYNNRGLWYYTYPFHIGLFLLIIWILLLVVGALAIPSGVLYMESTSITIKIIGYLILSAGILGFSLGIFGCIGLLIKRSTDATLKPYTAPVDYFNLSFILAVLLSAFLSYVLFDRTFDSARYLMRNVIILSQVISVNPFQLISLLLFSLFLIYSPFTKLMHGIAKYFMYHKVAWDDEPKSRGSALERKLKTQLAQPVTWMATHIEKDKKWKEQKG